jgi:hypothetical protein
MVADDRFIAAVPALPEFVAQDRDAGKRRLLSGIRWPCDRITSLRCRLRAPIILDEVPTHQNTMTEQVEDVRGHRCAEDLFGVGPSVATDRGTERRDCGKAVEQRRVISQVEEVARRKWKVHNVPATEVRPHRAKPRRVAVGQRTQQHGIHDAEDRRRTANAKSDRERRSDRECGLPPQTADSKGQVTTERFHGISDKGRRHAGPDDTIRGANRGQSCSDILEALI